MITPKVGNTYRHDGAGFQAATPKIYTGSEWKAIGQSFLLNDIPGAVGAWSLRQLNYNYTGPAVRVRRDNETKDIGFTASGNLDVQALEDFAAGGDVYVERWYDQSGEGNDAAQAAASEQPQIVSNGTVIKESGRATIDFEGSYLNTSNPYSDTTGGIYGVVVFSLNGNNDVFSVLRADKSWLLQRTGQGDVSFAVYDVEGRLKDWIKCFYDASEASDLNVTGFEYDNDFYRLYLNGNVAAEYDTINNMVVGTPSELTISHHKHRLKGVISEVVLYSEASDFQKRTTIEDNINNHYNIY